MNLFINENFIDTFASKVNIIQLIRQVADDEDVIQSEVLEVIETAFGDEEQDLINADDKHSTIMDDVLYCGPVAIRVIFNELYDEDYEGVIARICEALEQASGPTLRLDVNGFEVVPDDTTEVQIQLPINDSQPIDDTRMGYGSQTAVIDDVVTESKELFAEDAEEPKAYPGGTSGSIFNPKLPELWFGGRRISVMRKDGDDVVMYNVDQMYNAAYGIQAGPEFLTQLFVRRRLDIDPTEVEVNGSSFFASSFVLASLHGELSPYAEFNSIVSVIVETYEDCLNTENAVWSKIDLDITGNLK
jgi:hypothetical protein